MTQYMKIFNVLLLPKIFETDIRLMFFSCWQCLCWRPLICLSLLCLNFLEFAFHEVFSIVALFHCFHQRTCLMVKLVFSSQQMLKMCFLILTYTIALVWLRYPWKIIYLLSKELICSLETLFSCSHGYRLKFHLWFGIVIWFVHPVGSKLFIHYPRLVAYIWVILNP